MSEGLRKWWETDSNQVGVTDRLVSLIEGFRPLGKEMWVRRKKTALGEEALESHEPELNASFVLFCDSVI